MIEIRFENPKAVALPMSAEFRSKLESLVDEFVSSEEGFSKKKKVKTPKDAMGEPTLIVLLLTLLAKYKLYITGVAALIQLITAIRNLYISFLSKRNKKSDRTEKSDKLIIRIGEDELELPASDDDIEKFIKSHIVDQDGEASHL